MSDTPAPQPRIYSRRGNNCFPVWEQNVPSMGMCVGICSGGFAIRLHLIFGFAIHYFLALQMLIFIAAGFQIRPSKNRSKTLNSTL